MSAGGEIAIKIVGHADTRDIEAVRKAIAGLGPDFAKTARDISVEGDKAAKTLRTLDTDAGKTAKGFDVLGVSAAGMGKAVAGGFVLAAGAVAGLIGGAMHLDSVYGVVFDKLRTTAGATGPEFDALAQSIRNVAGNTPVDIKAIGLAISEVHARTGMTGPALEGLTKQILELSKISGTDASQNVELLTRMLGDASVPAEESAAAIDSVYRASTTTGVGVQRLAGLMVSFGAPMRNLGFTMGESAALLAKFEKEGVNTELVMGALKKASASWAKEGIKPIDGLTQVIAKIQELGPSAEATALAMDTFGLKAGGDLVDTILGGKFAIDDLVESIANGSDTVGSAAADIEGFDEAWLKAKNGILLAVLPMATAVSDAIGGMVGDFMTKAQPALTTLTESFALAQSEGADPFEAAFRALSDALDVAGFEGLSQAVSDLQVKWAEVVQAFEEGGFEAAMEEIVGFDLQPLIDGFIAAKDAILAAGGVLVSLGKFLIDHGKLVAAVIIVYGAFKTAMAINKVVAAAVLALGGMDKAWKAYKAGTFIATYATTSFGTALKLAMGPVGWIIIAVGLLYAAWKTNFGGIQEKTQAVVNWIKGVPAMIGAAWDQVKLGLVLLVSDFKAKFAAVGDGLRTAAGVLLLIINPLPLLFTKTGRDMVAGLWNGLKAGWDAMVGWITGKAKGMIKAVKGILRSDSPSRVFYDIGRDIILGLALGITENGRLADEAMRDAVAALWAFDAGGGIEAGKAKVDALIARIHGLRTAFLTGGEAEEGSVAWLLGGAGRSADELAGLADLDLGALFASLNIPVSDIDAFGRLLTQLVDAGELDRAQDLWSRFYDEISAREEAIHEQRVANIERDRTGALKLIEDVAKAQKAAGDAEAVRVARVIQNQRDAEQKTGAPASEIKEFDRLWRQSAENMRALLEQLNGGPIADIEKAFRDFWVDFNGGAVTGIANSQQLTEAIAALIEAVGKSHEDAAARAEAAWDAVAHTEEERHNHAVELLKARASLIDTLLADQALAEEALNALIAERARLLAEAEAWIKAAQKAAEEFEDRVHAGVMANIAEMRRAETYAHNGRMIHLSDEKKAIDAAHVQRLGQLQTQRDKVTKDFDRRRGEIEKERTALGQLKLDLGVEDALIRLTGLQDKLNDLKAIMDSFKVVSRGREALDEQRRAVTERVKITTDAQRKALQDVLASGTLSTKDARRVELLLLGRGTQKAEDVRRILGASADVLQGQIDAAQMIVDRNTLMVTAAERRIELAETQLSLDEQDAGVILKAIDDRIAKEGERYAKEMGAIDAKIAAEEDAFSQTMDWLDQLEQAEDDRHAKRMSDIAAEYALELAKLGMTQEQIDAMVAGAQREAARIAAETEAAFKRLREAAGLPGAIGATPGTLPTVGVGTLPPMPIQPGNPIIGLRPGGAPGGGMEINIAPPSVIVNPVPVTDNYTFNHNMTLVVGGQTLTEFNQQLDAQRQRDMNIGGSP